MKRDPVVLGENYILSGDDVGITRPNANVLIVGTPGCGKSTSTVLPTAALCRHSNPVFSYAKEVDAYRMAQFLRTLGYRCRILNISTPERSNISFDPLLSLESYEDIDVLATAIVEPALKKSPDDYWRAKGKSLLQGLIAATLMISPEGSQPGMANVLRLFDKLLPQESGYSVVSPVDPTFQKLEQADPNCYAVREYIAWHSLPYRTAACVRDTLAAALSTVFPESIRKLMQNKPQLDLEQFARNKEALIVVTNGQETSQQYYANLFFRNLIRQLLRLSVTCPNGELPREIRLIFDDFACTCPIDGFERDISLFRSAGISAILLLQSESQLEAIYSPEIAAIIRQNCAAYVYFPGGFDDRSCEIVSKRMSLPYEDILYAPLGKVFIMHSGRKPVHVPRYDTLNSREYARYLESASQKIPGTNR